MKVTPREILDELGLAQGDLVFVKASMDRLGYGASETVGLLEALVERVGPAGTLVMPSFPFVNEVGLPPPGLVLDVRRTPSLMGLLSEALRRYPGACRSEQYWVPASAWGRLAATLTEGQLDVLNPFGPGSTYRRLADHGVTMVGLGVSLNYNVLAHVADAVLAPRYPFRVFSEAPLIGTVVSADGRRHETRTITVSQQRRAGIKPARLIDASPRLGAATRFFDHAGGFAWSLPGRLYLDEALAIGQERLAAGRLPPWLEEMAP
jgi:aminoglycoside 3-N-acetyltransferase